ncbi:MAG TPA: proteasome protein [Mycobacteriales bacterium]|nr:proteasome protein [Mycobacteriales bacterium]
MTVVVAVVCKDGVVIGADTQVTDSDRGMSYPGQKLHPMGTHAAWAGSGARSVLGELEQVFAAEAEAICASPGIARALQERTLPVLEHHYDHYIADVPGESMEGGPSAYVPAAGWAGDGPWLVEVTPNGLATHYENVGFHAIGSGAPMAQQAGALLSHVDMDQRSVKHGVVGIVRVLDALRTTNPSVGLEIDVAWITADGAHHLDEEQIAAAREDVQRWREGEAKALDDLFPGD